MRILIEASEAYRNPTGIGKFSRSLIAALRGSIDPLFSPADYADRQHDHRPRTALSRGQHWLQHLWLTQGLAAIAARRARPDMLHSLSFFAPLLPRVPTTITIFDLAYFALPDATDRYWGAYARRTMHLFACRAAAVFTTSEVMRGQISARFALPPERIHVVYGGVDARFRPATAHDADAMARLRARWHLPDRYLLYVGAWGAHKNLTMLLEACAALPDLDLVITGRPFTQAEARLPDLARAHGVRAHFIGYVADDELSYLYHSALTAVLPSRYEGFGMPVIEAMACGTPIIVADIPVLREIAADAAPTFAPDDPARLTALIEQMVAEPRARDEWRARGLARAAHFTWAQAADRVITTWKALM